MNMHAGTSSKATHKAWPHPTGAYQIDENRSGQGGYDVERWQILTTQVRELAERNGFSQAETARRIQMPGGTFSQWYNAKYEGRLDEQNRKVAMWVEQMEEAGALMTSIVPAPGYVPTRTAHEFENTLHYAHQLGKMVVITASGGMGKTMALEHYRSTRPHCHLVTASEFTSTVFAIVNEIAETLGVKENDASKRVRAIGEFLSRNNVPTLLIIDEAQNLSDKAVNQVRHFMDIYKTGIALAGNTEIYDRFSKRRDGPSYAQIKRRVAKRINRRLPYAEDIERLLMAWNVTDADMAKYLKGIAMKDGALGSMCETLELAHLLASGDGKPLELAHLTAAWRDRNMEGY